MTDREAISKADNLRPNDIPDELKSEWLMELESNLAELMGVEEPISTFPEEMELLLQDPQSNVYPKYLVSMIDYYNQEPSLYANDSTMFNQALMEVRAWYRRNHMPTKKVITNVTI